MSTMTDALDIAVSATKGTKERTVKDGQRDMLPTVLAYRGDNRIALIQGPAIDRDQMLRIVEMAVRGYEADVVSMAFESWACSKLGMAELEKLGGISLQEAVRLHGALGKGWVSDCLMVTAANRAGDIVARTYPYEVKGRRLHWREEFLPPHPPEDIGGYVPDVIRQIMLAQPGMSAQEMQRGMEMFSSDEEQMWASRDCAVTKLMLDPPAQWQRQGFPEGVTIALGVAPGTKREQIIRRSMPHGRRMRWEG